VAITHSEKARTAKTGGLLPTGDKLVVPVNRRHTAENQATDYSHGTGRQSSDLAQAFSLRLLICGRVAWG
jgi:hypothetical protein